MTNLHCPACGYEIGLGSRVIGAITCPECGQALHVLPGASGGPAPKPSRRRAAWRLARWPLGFGLVSVICSTPLAGSLTASISHATGWLFFAAMLLASLVSPLTQSRTMSDACERAAFRRGYRLRLLLGGLALNAALVAAIVAVRTVVSGRPWW